MNIRKFLLIILDGWGIGDGSKSDVIASTPTPNLDRLKMGFPNSTLLACGEDVGLPEGQMGNSEVGHLNIGAGRIVYQDLVRIHKAVKENTLADNPVLKEAFAYARENEKQVHFLGLISDGGVHSHLDHLLYLCHETTKAGLKKVFIHALTDGRDTDPYSGKAFLETVDKDIRNTNVKFASLSGRYYTMDRDKRWERVKAGYDLMVEGKGKPFGNVLEAIQDSYNNGVTDEFIKPCVMVDDSGKPLSVIEKDDVVICFNFRTDRLREITMALTQKDMPEHGMKTMPLHYLTMTRYDESFQNVRIVFDNQNVTNTLGEYLSANKLTQLRIAETEKYPHVTFFFSGGHEQEFKGESRVMIPSPKVATYDLQPEMSAYLVTEAVIREIDSGRHDFICLNFANGDMVGHTGIYPAIQKAIQVVDDCVGKVVQKAQDCGYEALIIADHGNADYAVNPDGSPNTAHSLNKVPSILITNRNFELREGILADVAPTICTIMGLPVPVEMSGKSLIK